MEVYGALPHATGCANFSGVQSEPVQSTGAMALPFKGEVQAYPRLHAATIHF